MLEHSNADVGWQHRFFISISLFHIICSQEEI